MFDFDDYEDTKDYCFKYPAKEVIDSEYQKWLRKQKTRVPPLEYREYVIRFVKDRITFGHRKFGDVEPEWEILLYYIKEVETELDADKNTALEKAVILYDQALLLFCEGHPLPPNLIF